MDENNNNGKNKNNSDNGGNNPNKQDDNFDWSKIIRMVFGWGAVIVAAVIIMQMMKTGSANYVEISYKQYQEFIDNDKILKATVTKSDINDYAFKAELKAEELINDKKAKYISVYLPEPLIKEQETVWKQKQIDYSFDKQSNEWFNILISMVPWVLIIGVWFLFMRKMQGGGGGSRGIFSFGKSKAKLINQSFNKVTFKDVAGADEAKVELCEIIEFLKEPTKFQRLGGKIPRGVLLLGPPGTGKNIIGSRCCRRSGCSVLLNQRCRLC